MVKLVNNKNYLETDPDFSESFLSKKPTDCILYSEDGFTFDINKEILGQSKFLRDILASVRCDCETLEIFCPNSKEDLENIIQFLSDGTIYCDTEIDFFKILENLTKIYGFPNKMCEEYSTEFDISHPLISVEPDGTIRTKKSIKNSPEYIPAHLHNLPNLSISRIGRNAIDQNEIETNFESIYINEPVVTINEVKKEENFEKFMNGNFTYRDERKRRFQCNICKKRVLTKKILKRHYKLHERRNEVKTDEIVKEENFETVLPENQNGDVNGNFAFPNERKRRFQCDICKMSYFYRRNLSRHSKTHAKDKDLQIDEIVQEEFCERILIKDQNNDSTG